MTSSLEIVEAGPGVDPKFVAQVFGTQGDCSRCFCQYFDERAGRFAPNRARNLERLERQMETEVVGLVGVVDGAPVGWVQTGPLERYARFSEAAQYGDRTPHPPMGGWAVTCFVVSAPHRRSGVSKALLEAAVAYASESGAPSLDAHPVDTEVGARKKAASDLYFGILSNFTRAGFRVISRTSASRPVVRMRLNK